MQKPLLQVFIGLCLLISTNLTMADIRQGLWEIEIQVRAEGMPMPMPPYKLSQCMSKSNPVPKMQNQGNCKITKQRVEGNKASWEMNCATQQGKIVGDGSITFKDDSMSGRSSMRMDMVGQSVLMQTTFSGKRVGDC